MDDERAVLARRFRNHGATIGSSRMYSDLMARCAGDIEAGGPVAALMLPHAGPSQSVPALRLLGAVHRLVLTGNAPGLAAFYPSVGGAYDGDRAWPELLRVVRDQAGELEPYLDRTVQTNEVARTAALLGGFHAVSLAFGRPLRLLEVGASAGLLLRFDAYRYTWDGGGWGPPDSPVVLPAPALPLDPALRVAQRRGCDRSPVDATTDDGRLTLLSYVWPDMPDRVERLRAALSVTARLPVTVDAADAVAWVRARLAEDDGETVPVVYHSVVMQYLTPGAREEFVSLLANAAVSPRAWLRFEPEGERFVVRLTTWPGGEERELAEANGHGYDVRWLTT